MPKPKRARKPKARRGFRYLGVYLPLRLSEKIDDDCVARRLTRTQVAVEAFEAKYPEVEDATGDETETS